MVLKVAKRKAISQNPSTLLIYGPPKIGKTTMLSRLDKCLIIDTESGSNMVEGHILNANNRKELIDILKQAREGHEFKYIAIDTIDKVVQWAEEAVCIFFTISLVEIISLLSRWPHRFWSI